MSEKMCGKLLNEIAKVRYKTEGIIQRQGI